MSSPTGVTMVVIPNVMGITIYSPPLNKIQNSVRAVQFCQELIEKYQFHRYICSRTHICYKFLDLYIFLRIEIPAFYSISTYLLDLMESETWLKK